MYCELFYSNVDQQQASTNCTSNFGRKPSKEVVREQKSRGKIAKDKG
jgi:hypothetical protein